MAALPARAFTPALKGGALARIPVARTRFLPGLPRHQARVVGDSGTGEQCLHERSHGESFLDLATHRFGSRGLYLLDEPEAALSVHGCLAMLTRIRDLAETGSQFLVATHSPILLAVPHARTLQIDGTGTISEVSYDEA